MQVLPKRISKETDGGHPTTAHILVPVGLQGCEHKLELGLITKTHISCHAKVIYMKYENFTQCPK